MKKRTVLRSAAALALTVVMVLALALPALAASGTGSITIAPNGQESLGGDNRFTAYQIFKGDVNKDNTEELDNLEWGDGVDHGNLVAEMKTSHLSLGGGDDFGQAFTTAWTDWNSNHQEMDEAEFVAQWLGQHLTERAYADDFARLVAKHTNGAGKASTFTGDKWVINSLESGYYLVKDNYKSEAGHEEKDGSVSSYILQVVGNVTVDLKATIPTVEKKVDGQKGVLTETETAHTFTLTGTVSENIGEYDTYSYTFTDTISKGLTVTDAQLSNLTVEYSNISGTIHSATFTKNTDYTVNLPSANQEGVEHTLTVTFSNLKQSLVNRVSGIDLSNKTLVNNIRIVVTYEAQLNVNAVIGNDGNPNDVVLEYSNDPYSSGTGETIPDEVNTYTLALRIVKKGAENANLPDAEFKLMKGKNNDPNAAGSQFATFNEATGTDGAGKHETYQEIKGWEQGISKGGALKTNSNGEFNIHGLSAGTYTLVETKAPAGYETMKPIVFTITGTVDPTSGKLTSATMTVADASTRQDVDLSNGSLLAHSAQLTLTNFESPILPHTGGIGARIVYLVSALAVLTGAAIVVMAMRKRTRGRHEQSR